METHYVIGDGSDGLNGDLSIDLDPTKVDLEKMSRYVHISISVIKKFLNFPLSSVCDAKTLAEAIEDYGSAPENSEEELAALKKVEEFMLQDLENATTVDQIRDLFFLIPEGTPGEDLVLYKWIKSCNTIAEMRDILFVVNGETERFAILKLATFFLRTEV